MPHDFKHIVGNCVKCEAWIVRPTQRLPKIQVMREEHAKDIVLKNFASRRSTRAQVTTAIFCQAVLGSGLHETITTPAIVRTPVAPRAKVEIAAED
mmetsp:Transcript_22992/g.62400  ORF Transcript_22992/g.62400 Transcript_22992/m.62400 type:complete len:96 (+) Transcript_22992:415-702(+)